MKIHHSHLAVFSGFLERYFLALVLGVYALATVFPQPGQWLCGQCLGEIIVEEASFSFTLPMALLAALLWNASTLMPGGALRQLLCRPTILLVGLVANLLVPATFIVAVAQTTPFWHDPAAVRSILTGLTLIGSMPIAGSATAWSRKTNGNLALSLGLVVFSTLLSPLTTPIFLSAIGRFATDNCGTGLQDLAGHGTGTFLFLCVLAPCALGMLAPRVLRERRLAPLRPWLKPLNATLLLLLIYINASVSLPSVLTRLATGFLGMMLAIAVSFCLVAFAAGWLVARVLRAEPAEQSALMFGLGMNNNGAGMVLATAALADQPQVLLLIVCYNLVQHLVAGGVDLIQNRRPGRGQMDPCRLAVCDATA